MAQKYALIVLFSLLFFTVLSPYLRPTRESFYEKCVRERLGSKGKGKGVTAFTDRETHVYFWFPLLHGLSTLAHDDRREIRGAAVQVLFDILNFHGQVRPRISQLPASLFADTRR